MVTIGFAARVGTVACAVWMGSTSLGGAQTTPPDVVLNRHVALDPPPDEALGALVIGERLLVPDNTNGHVREYDLATGKQTAERGVLGSRPGETMRPMWVFTTGEGVGVDDWGRARLILFGRDWSFKREIPSARPSGLGFNLLAPPLWLGDHVVGAGVGRPEAFGGRDYVYLFSVRTDGTTVPLLWRDTPSGLKAEISSPLFGGGLVDLGSRGWAFLDPLTNEYRVFDRSDREVRRFRGEAQYWSAPDLLSRPTNRDRAAYFHWQFAQAALGQPVHLGDGRIGTIVRSRPEDEVVRYFIEVHDVENGSSLGTAELPLPRESRRYLLRTCAEAGRLVVVLRAGWSSGSATEVFDFRVGVGGGSATTTARQ